MSKRYKIGLVLSGGAARGLAHAGVLQALHEEGLFPDVISGVSAGAIIGAFYGDGYKPLELLDLFLEKSMLSFVKPTLPKQGLFRMSGLEEVLEEHLVARTFSDLKIPLFITATDFQAGKSVYFSEGLLIPRIIASSSIPVLFVPVFINGKMYMDGGLLDNLPLEPIQNQCELLIGVHVNPIGHADKPEGIMRIAERSFHMAIASQIENKIPLFDIFIEPLELRDYGLMDLKKAREMFGIGYHEARRVLAEYNRRKMHA